MAWLAAGHAQVGRNSGLIHQFWACPRVLKVVLPCRLFGRLDQRLVCLELFDQVLFMASVTGQIRMREGGLVFVASSDRRLRIAVRGALFGYARHTRFRCNALARFYIRVPQFPSDLLTRLQNRAQLNLLRILF